MLIVLRWALFICLLDCCLLVPLVCSRVLPFLSFGFFFFMVPFLSLFFLFSVVSFRWCCCCVIDNDEFDWKCVWINYMWSCYCWFSFRFFSFRLFFILFSLSVVLIGLCRFSLLYVFGFYRIALNYQLLYSFTLAIYISFITGQQGIGPFFFLLSTFCLPVM